MKEITFNNKQVIVVREDLKLTKGKVAVQVAHASVTAAIWAKENKKDWFKQWFSEGQKKVAVKVNSLKELYEIKAICDSLRVPSSLITDAGLTEIPPGTVTCLAVGPGPNEIIDKITGGLKLL